MYEKDYYIMTNKSVNFSDNDFRYFFWHEKENQHRQKWDVKRLRHKYTKNYVRNSIEVFMGNFKKKKFNNGRILMKILMGVIKIIFS